MLLKANAPKELKVEAAPMMYVTVPPEIYAELFGYVDEYATECSGCGLVERIEHAFDDGSIELEFKVKEIFLPNQHNSATASDVPAEETAAVVVQALQEGKDTEHMRLHWHSHVDMAVFHSGTDEENYEDFKTGDWLVSIVANKKRDLLARVDFYKPFRVKFIDIPVYVEQPAFESVQHKVKKNVKRAKDWESKNPKTYEYSGNGYTKKDYGSDYVPWWKDDAKDAPPEVTRGAVKDFATPNDLWPFYQALMQAEYEGLLETISDHNGNIIGFKHEGKHFEFDVFEVDAPIVLEGGHDDNRLIY